MGASPCLRCGEPLLAMHCKIVCPRCGYREDCSDAVLPETRPDESPKEAALEPEKPRGLPGKIAES